MFDWRRLIRPTVCVVSLLVVAFDPSTACGQTDRQDDPTPAGGGPPPAQTRQREPDPLAPHVFNLSVLGGRGLIGTLSPYSIGRGKVGVGGSVLNFDRNPGDIDFYEYGFQLAMGLSERTEVFLRATPVLRTNSVGQDPVGFPVPPLDMFVDTYPSQALRLGPSLLFAQEVPFKSYDAYSVRISPPAHGAFSQSSGSIAGGIKVNLLSEDRENRMGLGIRAYMEVPTEKPWYNTPRWHERAGVSGKTDAGFDLLGAKRFAKSELLVNLGYRHVGDPDRGIRLQYVDSSRTGADFLVGPTKELKLDLHDRIRFSAGAAFPVVRIHLRDVWLITEFDYTRYAGPGIPVERLVSPAEVRLGLQVICPWSKAVSLGMAVQAQVNDGGNGEYRTTYLHTPDGKGDINFGENVNPQISDEVKAFLASRGATFSPNSSKVFTTNNSDFDSWRTIDPAPKRVVSAGRANVVAFLTWRIN